MNSSPTNDRSTDGHSAPDFIIDDDDRYSRLRLIGWWDQDKISNAKILVVGAGALGNEVLKNLALLGIGTIYLIDFDLIQPSNLTRSVLYRSHHAGQPKAIVAAEMTMELNPDCHVISHHGDVLTDVGLGLVQEVNLVIGCLDNREARLWVNRMCFKANRPWIDGGIQEINGVAKVFMPPQGPCYECAMTENDYKLISLRYSCPLLKQEDILQGKVPTAPTIASIVGGIQVQEALKLLHGMPAAEGSALVFNGAANNFYKTHYPLRQDCLSHETYTDVVEHFDLSSSTTVGELFQHIRHDKLLAVNEYLHLDNLRAENLRLVLDRDFIISLDCRDCDQSVSIDRSRCEVNSAEGICSTCGQPMHPVSICEIEENVSPADRLNLSLASVGIPVYDIIKVQLGDRSCHLLLAGDRDTFLETWSRS